MAASASSDLEPLGGLADGTDPVIQLGGVNSGPPPGFVSLDVSPDEVCHCVLDGSAFWGFLQPGSELVSNGTDCCWWAGVVRLGCLGGVLPGLGNSSMGGVGRVVRGDGQLPQVFVHVSRPQTGLSA